MKKLSWKRNGINGLKKVEMEMNEVFNKIIIVFVLARRIILKMSRKCEERLPVAVNRIPTSKKWKEKDPRSGLPKESDPASEIPKNKK